jgi:methyl-accepting chemotaxis protein
VSEKSRKRSFVLETFIAMTGFGLLIGVVFVFAVEPFVEWVPGMKKYFVIMCLGAGLLVGLHSFGIAYWGLVRRVRSTARILNERCIRDGDLTFRLPIESRDSLGLVRTSINDNIAHTHGMVETVKKAVEDTDGVMSLMDSGINSMGEVNDSYEDRFKALSDQVSELERSMSEINDQMGTLSSSSQDTASAVLEQQATIGEIDQMADRMKGLVQETGSSLDEMKATMEMVTGSASEMSTSADRSKAIIDMMGNVVSGIRELVGNASNSAVRMMAESEEGIREVKQLTNAMTEIDKNSASLTATFENLNQAADSIGQIISVMEEIGDQTGLLALNASIIAAQAGDEGRAFAVVASEIRELSDRTTSSARDVTNILDGIQSGIRSAHNALTGSRETILQGVNVSHAAEQGLSRIVETMAESQQNIDSIDDQISNHVGHYQEAAEAMETLSGQVHLVHGATVEQLTGIDHIGKASGDLNKISSSIKGSLDEQGKVSNQISQATEKVTQLVGKIGEISGTHATRVDEIRDTMIQISTFLTRGRGSMDNLQENRQTAQKALKALTDSTRKFTV